MLINDILKFHTELKNKWKSEVALYTLLQVISKIKMLSREKIY